MIDLHTHVLPCMDDGAKSVDESMEMLADAYRQGVRICAATPHIVLHRDDAISHFLQRRRRSASLLSEAMQKSSAPFPRLLMGAEVFMDHDITRHSSLESLCLEGSPYLLVEFPLGAPYNPYWSEWLHSLIIRSFKPIIAHIDRYEHAEKMMADFSGLSITYQINAARFCSISGRRWISRFLPQHTPCVVASDMHNMTSRCCDMQLAHTKASKKNQEKADALFSGTATQMLRTYFGGEEYDKTPY